LSLADLETAVAELKEIFRRRDLPALIQALCRVVPEYQPSAGLLELLNDPQIRTASRMTRKIAVLTTSRADYSHLYWPWRDLAAHPEVDLHIIVMGSHLSPEFGNTVQEIEKDGFRIDARIECLLSSDTDVGMAKTIAWPR